MAREGIFNDIDAVVSWHPEKMYMVRTRPSLANVKVNYYFEGIPAHAGSAHLGRSALDAVELMNVGVNFLREHMDLSCRIHYAILDAGGTAPNMVQSHARLQYMIRAVDAPAVRDLHARVDRIAQGATMMTDTTVTSRVVSAYANLITIPTLHAVANEAMHDIPLPVPTQEELAYGRALQATMGLSAGELAQPPFADRVLDPAPPVAHGGSTDTADVSWNCPTVQMHIGNWVKGTPGHSWQSASQCRGSYAKRAMLYAGKAVAGTILRLMEDPALLAKAKAEHKERIGDGYVCGIPDDVMPEIK
jgi:aminobenzoyl-glutamate utilization protein B